MSKIEKLKEEIKILKLEKEVEKLKKEISELRKGQVNTYPPFYYRPEDPSKRYDVVYCGNISGITSNIK